jgi:hypothetical protein
VIGPVFDQPIRLFPTPRPTFVLIPIPPAAFHDNPIRDIPDADLTPVQQQATSVRARADAVNGKGAGELIRAEDWNAMATAVSDLANAVLELTHLVSPVGHEHPEIAEKIDEVQGNVRRFTESFGRSLLELRREAETGRLRGQVEDTLAGARPDVRADVLERIADLERNTLVDSTVFTTKLSSAGARILTALNETAGDDDAPDDFLVRPNVVALQNVARTMVETGPQMKAEGELSALHAFSSTRKRGFGGVRGG